MWKLIYNLFERRSVYRYGRVELIMFFRKSEYMVSSHVQSLKGCFFM